MGILEYFGFRKKLDDNAVIILSRIFDEEGSFQIVENLTDDDINYDTVVSIINLLHSKGLVRKMSQRGMNFVGINIKKIKKINRILDTKK